MKSCSKKILIDMIKPKKNTMHLLCRLTPIKKLPVWWVFVKQLNEQFNYLRHLSDRVG